MADHSRKLDSLFFAALEIESLPERVAFLDESCGDDKELRGQIEKMLKSHLGAGNFLERPAPELQATVVESASSDARARSLQAGLAAAFTQEHAVLIGDANNSVLKSLGKTMTRVPRIALRESIDDGVDPIVRPSSSQMPQRDGDSRYRIDGEIARGGMGAILKGRDIDLGRDLAIKVLLDAHKDQPDVIQRFVEEAQIGGQLQHPGIAPVYELGQFADKRPFFAMKLVKGETLSILLADRKNVAEERRKFIGIFEQVCQTMAYAHSRGVIHRDLKPANIMVGAFGEVQVMDWGLAKVLSSGGVADEKKAYEKQQGQSIIQTLRSQAGSDTPGAIGTVGSQTQMGSVMGTPAYMAPEQALGEIDNLDERADVFGLGAILCEILTGKPPYVANDHTQVFRLASRGKLDDCFQRLEQCESDGELVALTKLCLEMEPADRPRNAGALAGRVTQYIESVETRLREAELERASEAARADAERQRAESESRRVEQQRRSATVLRRILGGLAVVTVLAGIACVSAMLSNSRANALARIALRNEADAKFFASEASSKAELASENARRAEAASTEAKSQLTRSEWLLYASKLMLAQTDFESGNGGLAALFLNQAQPEMRGWEHRYLSTRVNARQTLAGHLNVVNSAAYSPDGKRIVTGSWDQTAKVWDAATGQEVFTLNGQDGYVMCVAFSPNGNSIATAGGPWGEGKHPGFVKLWDATNGELILDIKGHDYCVWSMAFSPDGKRIVAGGGDWVYGLGEVKVWDSETGRDLLTLQGELANVRGVAFSPDGKRIATGSIDYSARVWDATTGQQLRVLEGHRDLITSLAFSSDGKRLLTGGGDGTAVIWDVEQGDKIQTLIGHAASVSSVAFSPDDQSMATGSWDQTIKVWTSRTGQENFTLKGHAGYVRGIAFSPDGRRIVSSSEDHSAKVWDADKGQEIPVLKGHIDALTSIDFCADSQRFVIGSQDNSVSMWNTASGHEIMRVRVNPDAPNSPWDIAAVWGATISRDGQRIAAASQDKTARVWNSTTGQELLVLNHADVVSDVAFSPDRKRIVTGCFDLSARVWDAVSGKELFTLRGHTGYVNRVAFSPDGTRIVSASWDETAKIWDAATGQEIVTLRGHQGYVMCIAFSPDGKRIATGSRDKTAKLWDVASGQELFTLKGHTGGAVRSLAFSPDGTRIVTGGDDRTAKVWDTGTGQEVLTFGRHNEAVYAVAWSPDGNRVVTCIAGAEPTAKVWSAETPRELLVLDGHTESVSSVAFSDDGQRVFAWDREKKLLAWSVVNGEPVTPLDPPPEPLPGPAHSPDGFHHAVPEDICVVLSNTSPLPENEWPLPNSIQRIRYHSDKAMLAKQQNQGLAAEFHLQQVALAETELVQLKRLQAMLRGEDAPIDNTECLTFAQLADNRGEYSLAYNLWNKALENATTFDDELSSQLRYNTARAAILAAAGEGNDEPRLNDSAKATLLSHVSGWLNSELAAGNVNEPIVVEVATEMADMLLTGSSGWVVLKPTELTSENGATLTLHQDGSILVSGTNANGDVYAVRGSVDVDRIGAVRLEVAPDPSLPNQGPGRHPSGNFQLSALRVFRAMPDHTNKLTQLPLENAYASFDFKAADADIGGLVDERLDKVWHVWGRFGQPHYAVFAVHDPTDANPGQRLVIELHHKASIEPVNLGHFRISVSDAPVAADREQMRFAAMQLTDPWQKFAAAYKIREDQQKLEELLAICPSAAAGIGELYAAVQNWELAISEYNNLITAETSDAALLSKRAAAYVGFGQWDRATADFRRAVELQPDLAETVFNRFASEQRWNEATTFGTLLIEQRPDDTLLWVRIPPMAFAAHDETAYRSLCRRVIELFPRTPTPEAAERVIKACLLDPIVFDPAELPIAVMADALDAGTVQESMQPWLWTTRALAAYRSGDPAAAIKYLIESEQYRPIATTQAMSLVVQALAHHQLQQPDEARAALKAASQLISRLQQEPILRGDHDLLIAEILFQEAERNKGVRAQ